MLLLELRLLLMELLQLPCMCVRVGARARLLACKCVLACMHVPACVASVADGGAVAAAAPYAAAA
jgi:hypothetical protein